MLFLLITIPMFHLSNLLNIFAVVEGGIIFGARFVPWRKIKSFEFVRIDVKHNYYGFTSEVNDQYELKVKTSFRTLSSIITSEEIKGRISNIVEEHKQMG
ncbi:hypothetical protein [Oceanobacillus bengalensis]|nr:hypothetical protein [Oceanobacillus bengalensis]